MDFLPWFVRSFDTGDKVRGSKPEKEELMIATALVAHLESFRSGANRSAQWAKDAETLLDVFGEQDDILDELQDALSVYRPGGGPHLLDEDGMERLVVHLLGRLKSAERRGL